MSRLRGVYTAIITPFDAAGEIDWNGLQQNIRFQIENKVDGIVALGTTGEAPTLSLEEKLGVIRMAKEETKGKIALLVGTGSYATNQTIESTRQAEDLGADGALIVTPYYNKPTQEGIYRHFKAIATAVKLPVVIYNVQGRAGQNIQTDTLKRIADLPNIVGVKEASGNIAQIGEVIEMIARHRPAFSVLCGDDALTLPCMALGGHGVISVASNLIPLQIKSLVGYSENGDYGMAREIHYQLLPFLRAIFIETNPIPIKAAMAMCGMPAGICRLPLCDLMPENEKKLRNVLETLMSISFSV